MMIKINARESVEIVEHVFVNVINDEGSKYQSWDELTDQQQDCFSRMNQEIQAVYSKYKECMS